MNPVAVVLVNDNPQPPARQRPVAQALDNVGSPVVAEYAGRSAGVRGLAGTHSRWHTEAVKEKGKCLYTRIERQATRGEHCRASQRDRHGRGQASPVFT